MAKVSHAVHELIITTSLAGGVNIAIIIGAVSFLLILAVIFFLVMVVVSRLHCGYVLAAYSCR